MLAVIMAAVIAFSATSICPGYAADDSVIFDDTAAGSTEKTAAEDVSPGEVGSAKALEESEVDVEVETVDVVEPETKTETNSETKPAETEEATKSETEAPDPHKTETPGAAETETPGVPETETSSETDTEAPETAAPETEEPVETEQWTVSGNDADTEAETPGGTDPGNEVPEPPVVVTPSDAEKNDEEGESETENTVREPAKHDFVFEPDEDTLMDGNVPYGEKVSVGVDLLDGAALPDGAVLKVKYLEPGAPEYEAALSAVTEAMALPEDSISNALLYDIYFLSEGEEVEPEGRVRVTVGFRGSSEDVSWRTVVHAKDDGTADVLDTEWSDKAPADGIADDGFYSGVSGDVVSARFEVDGFSLFGFVEKPEEAPALPAEFVRVLDDGTVVTVALDEGVRLPDGAEFHAGFLDEDDPRMAEAMEALREAMGLTLKDTMNFFPCDIYFTDADGSRIDMDGSMRVTVEFGSRFADVNRGSRVVRLNADGTAEELAPEWSGDGHTVTFAVNSLSLLGFAAASGKEHDFTYELSGSVTVAIDLQEGSTLPEGAVLEMRPVEQDSPEYAGTVEAAMSGLAAARSGGAKSAFYDIRFMLDGEEVRPTGGVRVTVLFDSLPADVTTREVVQVKDNGPMEPVEADWTENSSAAAGDGEDFFSDEVFSDEGLADGGHVNVGAADNVSAAFDVDGISLFGLMEAPGVIRIAAAESSGVTVTWGSISTEDTGKGVTVRDENIVHIWDVSGSTKRTLDVPVEIDASVGEEVKITLPRYIKENVRTNFTKFTQAEIVTEAAGPYCDGVEANETNVVLTIKPKPGAHVNFQLPYKFDCWGVISGKEFTVDYKIQVGTEDAKEYKLTGKIITGSNFKIVTDYQDGDPYTYFNSLGRDNGYSLSDFGGADRKISYILNLNSVYEKYFGCTETAIGEGYIYDIVPVFVRPSGQQPYDISGTVTVGEHDEILGGVYMMDSRSGSKAPWKKLVNTGPEENKSSFTFSFEHDDSFEGGAENDTLINRVVTGNLTENVDNQNYTLYFLVRYKIEYLEKELVYDETNWKKADAYTLSAKISLTHTGVDAETDESEPVNQTTDQTAYRGVLTQSQVYDAYYQYYLPNQQDALSNLAIGTPSKLNFKADFFCYNEAREDFDNSADPKPHRLEAVIDLLYLTSKKPYEKSDCLGPNDYSFTKFNLSLVDAPGNWSQNWYYEDKNWDNDQGKGDHTVWKEQRPNIGWPADTWGTPKKSGYKDVIVYGSKSIDGNDWEQIETIKVNNVWAKDQGRDVNVEDGKDIENYIRLKVVYDSRWTTALRVAFQIELKPGILNTYPSLKTSSSQELTVWFNYFGYDQAADDQWTADLDDMNCGRYPHFDGDWSYNWTDEKGEKHSDRGTAELARQHDKEQAGTTKFNDWDEDQKQHYSMRDYVRLTLGRSEDQAGMLITQALYDSFGHIVGNNLSTTQDSGSFCKEKNVTDVSEIVYSISGGITSGALNQASLNMWREKAKNDPQSPYNSVKMRYYVLLPQDFKLNENAEPAHSNGNGDTFLSATPVFYEGDKHTGAGDTVVTSNSNIPAWTELSYNGALSEMKWNEAGKVEVNRTLSKDRLVVFDRTLDEKTLDEVFNLHGATETYFWGRGFSFSAVPERGTGTIWPGDYETQVWCQYLDENDNPIPLDDFQRGEGVSVEKIPSVAGQGRNTLLYIPSKFHNNSVAGTTKAEISLESAYTDKEGKPNVQFDMDYKYKLEYAVSERPSRDVILWTNIEEEYVSDPQYRGTVTGVDLGDLDESIQDKVRVYVRKEKFDAEYYIREKANQSWLPDTGKEGLKTVTEDQKGGWTEVTKGQMGEYDWSDVKAVAFYFEGVTFIENESSKLNSAIVKVNMKGPKLEGKYLDLGNLPEKTFDANSPLIFSDSHEGEEISACTPANSVPVSITVRPITLPETGGPGVTTVLMHSFLACLAGAALVLAGRKRKKI